MASWREKLAAKAGMSLKAYLKTDAYKKAKKERDGGSSSEKSKDQKKSEKEIKKYYKEKSQQTEASSALQTKKLQQDVANIMRDSGIAGTRATEDYIRNIGNIAANKSADVNDLNDYVKTNTGRIQEDLDTSLAKESRRYSVEYDRINQNLADTGMTFSERRPEQIAKAENLTTIQGIQTEANRSFADIQRYEAAKNRDIELKYGQQTEQATTAKTRTLEDILNEQKDAQSKLNLGQESIALEKATALKDISYGSDTDIATTGQLFEQNALSKQIRDEQQKF